VADYSAVPHHGGLRAERIRPLRFSEATKPSVRTQSGREREQSPDSKRRNPTADANPKPLGAEERPMPNRGPQVPGGDNRDDD
jgi:hypothetical protein